MIVAALRHGAPNARTKEHIAASFDPPLSTRMVELAIQEARLAGAPICSDENGYWLGDAAEVAACAQRLRRRYVTQALTARALSRTAARMAGYEQRELWAA